MKTISKQVCGGSQKRLKKWWIEVCDNNYETYHEANTIGTSMILYDVIQLILNPVTFVWSFKLGIEWWRVGDADDWFIILHCKKSRENVEKSDLFSQIRVFFIWEKKVILRKKSEFGRKLPVLRIPLSGFVSVWAPRFVICYW